MLLVEDEAPCRRAMQRVLRAHGFVVHAVASAEEAVQLLSSKTTTVSCMIVDVDLPGMCGLDLVRYVQASGLGIRPMLVTAADRIQVQRFAAEYEVEYFPKPLDIDEFLDAISTPAC